MEKTITPNPRIPMSRERIAELYKEAMVYNNLAYVLTEAVNTLVGDMETRISTLGLGFKREEKVNFTELVRAVRRARYYSGEISKALYEIEESGDALHDADWWYYFVKLVMDRTGDDPQKTHLLLEYLDTMPSDGLFDVGIKDFRSI